MLREIGIETHAMIGADAEAGQIDTMTATTVLGNRGRQCEIGGEKMTIGVESDGGSVRQSLIVMTSEGVLTDA